MITLVLLPGLDGTGLMLADFVASLEPGINAVVASYPSSTPLGYAELEPIARSFLPRDQPYYLLAESFSGPVAVSIAASSPTGLCGLILCSSFARNPLPLLAPFRSAIRFAPVTALPMALLSFFVLGRFATSSRRDSLALALARVAPSVLRARASAALSVDVSALLQDIKVPVLYLRASEDRVVPKPSSKLVESLVADIRVVELTAPHFLLQVAPSQAAAVVANFMRNVDAH